MKVSIITAVYNSVSTLQNTIESIHSQSYSNIEHIIIDGNSSDGSAEIAIKNISERCKVIRENDDGYYHALNKGLVLADGEIIGILNADDVYIDSNLIEILSTHFANDENLDCIYGDLDFFCQKNGKQVFATKWIAGNFSNRKIKYGWMPPHPAVFLRRSVYKSIGEFDLRFSISSDYDLMLRAFANPSFKSKYISKSFVRMQLGGLSNKSWKNIINKMTEDYAVMKKNQMPATVALLFKNLSKLNQIRRLF